jgi:hypothetical protein
LKNVDQNTVDNSMEWWLNDFKNTITWNAWLFGHFHDDRIVQPSVEMFYTNIDNINTIFERHTQWKTSLE